MKDIKDTSWGEVADWYDDLLGGGAGTYQQEVILPNLIRILGLKGGEKIADVACGQGFFARAITTATPDAQVIASDISPELIKKAKAAQGEISSKQKITYHVAPSHELGFIKDGSVDKVIIVLALQNIEKYVETVAECARILSPVGSLVVVLNHPAFRIPKRSSWGTDASAHTAGASAGAIGSQYRRIDAYMSESREMIDMAPGKNAGKGDSSGKITYSFHRPLQSYFKAFAKSGLSVVRLEEWISHKTSQPGPKSRATEENRIRKEIPLFMCIECVS